MSYTSPGNNVVDFTFDTTAAYSIPDNDTTDFTINTRVESDLSTEVTATTILPTPSSLTVDVDGDKYVLSWLGNANNGTYEVLLSANGGDSFVTDGNSKSAPASMVSTTEYNSANKHTIKVRLSTDHKSNETGTVESILAGSVSRTTTGVVQDEQPGIVMTDKE